MIIDGRSIAEEIYRALHERVSVLRARPRLGILTCAPTFATEKYLALKERKAAEVGIVTEVVRLGSDTTTEAMITALTALASRSEGVIVQLPLPQHIDTDAVIAAIPPAHDVDALNPETRSILSPVVGAIAELVERYDIPLFEKHVVIIGSGRLVGQPAYRWCTERGAAVSIVTKDTADIGYYTRSADLIISGAGAPGLITPDMVKEGVAILDAGTSEDGGVLRGDAHPDCALKSALFTPVPGGIGPITIAVLLRNVVARAESNEGVSV